MKSALLKNLREVGNEGVTKKELKKLVRGIATDPENFKQEFNETLEKLLAKNKIQSSGDRIMLLSKQTICKKQNTSASESAADSAPAANESAPAPCVKKRKLSNDSQVDEPERKSNENIKKPSVQELWRTGDCSISP